MTDKNPDEKFSVSEMFRGREGGARLRQDFGSVRELQRALLAQGAHLRPAEDAVAA